MLVSFVYVLGCRVLEFVVLLLRGERSKELEIVVARRVRKFGRVGDRLAFSEGSVI